MTMQSDIRVTNLFRKRIKKLEKKYPNIKSDVLSVIALIDKSPEAGDRLQGLKEIYKIRVPSTDMQKGKSGSFRMIYYLFNAEGAIFLLTIYSKAKQEKISVEKIKELLSKL